MGSCSLLQGVFPTQGSNSGLPHCRWFLYHLSHQGSPILCILEALCGVAPSLWYSVIVSLGIISVLRRFYNSVLNFLWVGKRSLEPVIVLTNTVFVMLLRSVFIIVHNSWTLTSGPFSAVFLVISHLIFIYFVRPPLLPSQSTLLATYICFICFILYLLFSAALGLRCCMRAFSSCREQGPLFVAVHGLLIVVASLWGARALGHVGLYSCGSQAQLLHGMQDPSGPEIKPVSLALAGGFPTTGPPGNSLICFILVDFWFV